MIEAKKALQRLQEGNARFVSGNLIHPNRCEVRREELLEGQNPFVAILSCSDSRTPGEIVFDQGLGDLFMVRVAGNILAEEVIGSLAYAVNELDVNLIVVMGHDHCGAITAALKDDNQCVYIKSLLDKIKPIISSHNTVDDLEKITKRNVKNVVNHLKDLNLVFNNKLNSGKLEIIGAYHDLETGIVDFDV
jgi:carbonic anhydrase